MSEYMRSYRYLVRESNFMSDGRLNPVQPYLTIPFRTLRDARAYAKKENS